MATGEASIDTALAERIIKAIDLADHGAVRLDKRSWSRFGKLLGAHGVTYDEARGVAFKR